MKKPSPNSEPSLKSTSRLFPFEAKGHEAVELMRLPLLILSTGRVLIYLLGLGAFVWALNGASAADLAKVIGPLRRLLY